MWPVLWIAGHLLVVSVAIRLLYIYADKETPDATDNKSWAGIMGLIWPLTLFLLLLYGIYKVSLHVLFRETPRQRKERLVEELAENARQAREQAENLGLPMPQANPSGKERGQ